MSLFLYLGGLSKAGRGPILQIESVHRRVKFYLSRPRPTRKDCTAAHLQFSTENLQKIPNLFDADFLAF